MSKSDRRYERFRLSRYLAIQLAETVFTPDEPLVPLKKISISRVRYFLIFFLYFLKFLIMTTVFTISQTYEK